MRGDGGSRRVLGGVAIGVGAIVLGRRWARYRRAHLRWGATDDEIAAPMPGDELVPHAPFCATRAITIAAPPAAVWPWIVQIGVGRAGFYSYDWLDNHGQPSADVILPEHQDVAIGDVAAPMTADPDDRTSFRVFGFEEGSWLGWAKPGSTWVWTLRPLASGAATRLVVRLKEAYAMPGALVTAPLLEAADFPMIHKELLGIKHRAEAAMVGAAR